ncbi:ABC transporter permease [Simkania negevensis]|uniref:ABC transporter permease n=1 Tax=Simkania negevensis TaxID=83561 RepID=A0ABS3AQ92_9BACT|nr:ABC transporter permease [Simkania negevensis]
MASYLIRRLLLLPLTLFCIVLVNFIIINLAPGDPVTVGTISDTGDATRSADKEFAFGRDDQYLNFREHYGLTLPILFNSWPSTSYAYVKEALRKLDSRENNGHEMSVKEYDQLRIRFGDRSKYLMGYLLAIAKDPSQPFGVRKTAMRFFVRGGTQQAYLGPGLSEKKKRYNRKIARSNNELRNFLPGEVATKEEIDKQLISMEEWYKKEEIFFDFNPSFWSKVDIFFTDTRFFRYMSRVTTLDFGTLRNDNNKTVISEVVKRFKYSLTLALLPMLLTFIGCQIVGFTMAIYQNRWPDFMLNIGILILYAVPVFVVAPFLIEKVALPHTVPFTDIPIPFSGFNSPEQIYQQKTTLEKVADISLHIALPLVAVMYGSLAAQARLSRTAVLEVLRQDYVRTARAKGLPPFSIYFKHVGRNAAITIVTSIAASLGVILGGSLIIETIFGIDGFGKFFYDAVVNRDFNVIMFSAISGAFLALVGYLVADVAYTFLDPRVTLE